MKNQKGMSLVAVLAAVALVAGIAVTVAMIVSSGSKKSAKTSASSACHSVVNSVLNALTQDGHSLFINSLGPSSPSLNFPVGGRTIDGLMRSGGSTPALVIGPRAGVPAGQEHRLSLDMNVRSELPQEYRLQNSININNSLNRLVALASVSDFNICCQSRDMGDPNCGATVYEIQNNAPLATNLGGLDFTSLNRDVQIRLAANFTNLNTSLCVGNRLPTNQLPSPRLAGGAQFTVRVTLSPNTNQEEVCEGSSAVSFSSDQASPLTLVSYETIGVCPAGSQVPLICANAPVSNGTIRINLRTVQDSVNCRTQCLARVTLPTCSGTIDPLTDAQCQASCLNTDPGSLYFCRIGERNWFRNNPNFWEPCHQTNVYDFDGTVAGAVRIEYQPEFTEAQNRTETTTRAQLTLTSLRADRTYQVDVRAADTFGSHLGPSFCSASASCPNNDTLLPAFVVSLSAPRVTEIVETSNTIGPAQGPGANVFPTEYQCTNAPATWRVQTDYNIPAGVYNYFPINRTCASSLEILAAAPPGGGAMPTFTCTCSGIACDARATGFGDVDTRFRIALTVTNACNRTSPASDSYEWCYDITENFVSSVVVNGTANPNLTFTSDNICGVALNCPIAGGGRRWMYNSCDRNLPDWNISANSGCVNGYFCATNHDPCGRPSGTMWGLPLPPGQTANNYTSMTGRAPTSNHCGGAGGNRCESGYCAGDFQCYDTCFLRTNRCYSGLNGESNTTTICNDNRNCPANPARCDGDRYRCVSTSPNLIGQIHPSYGVATVGANCLLPQSCVSNPGSCMASRFCNNPPCITGTIELVQEGRCVCPSTPSCPGRAPVTCPTFSTCS